MIASDTPPITPMIPARSVTWTMIVVPTLRRKQGCYYRRCLDDIILQGIHLNCQRRRCQTQDNAKLEDRFGFAPGLKAAKSCTSVQKPSHSARVDLLVHSILGAMTIKHALIYVNVYARPMGEVHFRMTSKNVMKASHILLFV